jgi:hypothetical protein
MPHSCPKTITHVAEQAAIAMPYEEARELVARFRPSGRFGGADPYESGLGMQGVDGGGNVGHS